MNIAIKFHRINKEHLARLKRQASKALGHNWKVDVDPHQLINMIYEILLLRQMVAEDPNHREHLDGRYAEVKRSRKC